MLKWLINIFIKNNKTLSESNNSNKSLISEYNRILKDLQLLKPDPTRMLEIKNIKRIISNLEQGQKT